MAKATVGLREADGSVSQFVAESLPGGNHLVQHVATAIRDVLDYGLAAVTVARGLPNIPAGATHAFVTVESGGGDLRWRSDGNDPAPAPTSNADAGLLATAGTALEIALEDLSLVRVVATTGTTIIVVEYAKLDS